MAQLRFLVLLILGFLPMLGWGDEPRKPQDYVPPELQAVDPGIRDSLTAIEALAKAGKYPEAFQQLQKALAFCDQKGLPDKALLQANLGASQFVRGHLEEAKQSWADAYANAVRTGNLVLQADTLVALGSLAQSAGKIQESIDLTTRALDLARRSKNFWMQSRCLGELGRLQLNAGKIAEARSSIEEALRIDRLNQYGWEASHLLYLAWVTASDSSKLEQAASLARSARELAARHDDYIVVIQASTTLAHLHLQSGKFKDGILLLENSSKGLDENGKPLVQATAPYLAAVSLPYLHITFLETMALVYQSGGRPEEAIQTWQELYDVATEAGFNLAAGEAAHGMADLYKTKKQFPMAISNYELAADAWHKGGNAKRRIDALSSKAYLLFQSGQGAKALDLYEELLPLVKSFNDKRQQLFIDLAIAEIIQPQGELERTTLALDDAETVLASDASLLSGKPDVAMELYLRLADLHDRKKQPVSVAVALEKAMSPAEALGLDRRNTLAAQITAKLADMRVIEAAEKAYSDGDFKKALTYYELQEHFDRTDARWNGKTREAGEHLANLNKKLVELTFKIIDQAGGASFLETNLQELGPIADSVRLPSMLALLHYYGRQTNFANVVRVATAALPYLHLGQEEQPHDYDVEIACDLPYALLLQKEVKSAAQQVGPCLRGAQKLGDTQRLAMAHQINLWVLQAANRQDEAQESAQFLLQHAPQDAAHYVELAQLKERQGETEEAVHAWQQALELYATGTDLKNTAATHLNLATALSSWGAEKREEAVGHFEAALSLYERAGDAEDQGRADLLLAHYYVQKKEYRQASRYLEAALKLSKNARIARLEAWALSEYGQYYRSSGNVPKALESYLKSAELYHSLHFSSLEAFQMQSASWLLEELHKPEEALQTALKTQTTADNSGDWSARYWARRTLSNIYENKLDYESSLASLREAQAISTEADQPLSSAWAILSMAADLTTIGEWNEALDNVNLALPVVRKFKDKSSEIQADSLLISIYGQRESYLKDFDKALEYYRAVTQLVGSSDLAQLASLSLDVEEIYWQQKRYQEAEAKANESLDFYRRTNNESGEANALISLAEAQLSKGDIASAALSLKRAGPLVKKSDDLYLQGRLLYAEARQRKREGNLRDAAQKYERVIEMLEQFKATSNVILKQKASENYSYIYDELIDTWYLLSKEQGPNLFCADKALQYAELNKARIFTTSWGRTFTESLRRQVPAPLQEKERLLDEHKTALMSELEQAMSGQGSRPVAHIREDLRKLEADRLALQRELRQVSPAYAEAQYPQPTSISGLPLRAGEVLVEFKMMEDALLVWMIGGTQAGPHLKAFYKVNRPRSWFEERIFSIRSAFNREEPDQFDPQISQELFNTIFPASYAQSLLAAETLVFVPDDILFLLPFEILSPEAAQSKFVLLKSATTYFPSAGALRLSRAVRRAPQDWPAQFFAIADPITDKEDERYIAASTISEIDSIMPDKSEAKTDAPVRGPSFESMHLRDYFFERIPETAVEVNNIARLFPSEPAITIVRTGMEARKREMLQTDLGKFRFLHFATHGFLPVEPGIREPALVLSYDGKDEDRMMLSLSEILSLKLHAEMVVLSACNTGSGKVTRAEGVASLGMAFLSAGAESATVSLWQVPDKSTSLLMQEFYKNLLHGMSKSQALASARESLVRQGYSNPFFWAPFVLTGE